MAKTVIQLLGELVVAWGRLTGPIIPPGSNYAQASQIEGFTETFGAFCSEVNATAEQIAGMQEQLVWPSSQA